MLLRVLGRLPLTEVAAGWGARRWRSLNLDWSYGGTAGQDRCLRRSGRNRGQSGRCRSKIGASVVSQAGYAPFHPAEVAVPRELFRKILGLVDGLGPAPLPP
jgi:hypothetical protein